MLNKRVKVIASHMQVHDTPEHKEIMAAASGWQRKLHDGMVNQAKQLRMSYTREYKLEVVKAYMRLKELCHDIRAACYYF